MKITTILLVVWCAALVFAGVVPIIPVRGPGVYDTHFMGTSVNTYTNLYDSDTMWTWAEAYPGVYTVLISLTAVFATLATVRCLSVH